MAEELAVNLANTTQEEFNLYAEVLKHTSTQKGDMLVLEDGKPKRILEPPRWGAILVRIEGTIEWWPDKQLDQLSPGAEVFGALDGTPQFVLASEYLSR